MDSINKTAPILLILILAANSSFIILQSASAQSTPNPSVPEFTLKQVDNSYNVAPTITSTTDPYTNKTTTTTIPGYHVENKTIEAIITSNLGASYYNFRYKPHYIENWTYYPFNPDAGSSAYTLADSYSVPFKASDLVNTTLALYFIPQSIAPNSQIDIQVQALYGNFDADPYGHIMPLPGGPTYDFYFRGETSGWSNSQIVTVGESLASSIPSPTTTLKPTAHQTAAPTATPASTATSGDTTSGTISLPTTTFALFIAAFTGLFVGLLLLLIYRTSKGKLERTEKT
jgi:hypothetical protein